MGERIAQRRSPASEAALPTRAEAVDVLVSAKTILACAAAKLSPGASGYLWTAIDYISDEIDQLVARSGNGGDAYNPATNAFRTGTEQGRRFLGILSDIVILSSRTDPVAGACAAVLMLMPPSLWCRFA